MENNIVMEAANDKIELQLVRAKKKKRYIVKWRRVGSQNYSDTNLGAVTMPVGVQMIKNMLNNAKHLL